MALPTPPPSTQPIPNSSFYSQQSETLSSAFGPLIVGTGLEVNYLTGVLSAITGGAGGGTITQINTGIGLSGGPITTAGTIALSSLVPNPVGNYSYITHINVDSYGRVTFLQSGGEPVYKTTYNARGAILAGTAPSSYAALPPGFTNQVLTADTACPLGLKWTNATGGVVAEVCGLAPIAVLNGASATPTVTICDASTTEKGAVQLTSSLTTDSAALALTASGGKSLQDQVNTLSVTKGTVCNVSAALPLYVNGVSTESPEIAVCTANLTQQGVVQLSNALNSPSNTLALTASAGYCLQQQIDTLSSAANLTLAGTIDAVTGLIDEPTAIGASSGFVAGDPLPLPSVLLRDYYVIVTTPGTFTPTGGSTPLTFIQGDWVVDDGTQWIRFAVGLNPAYATETTPGVVCLSSPSNTLAGLDTQTAVTPAGLQDKMSDDPTLASSTRIASSCALSQVSALATDSVLCCTFAGKGYLVSGSGVGAIFALSPGTDGQVLTVDSGSAGGLCWNTPAAVPSATALAEGTVFLASNAEVQAGVITSNKAINPASLQSKVLDSVACDSSEFIASSKAVKLAYDTAIAAQTNYATELTAGTICIASNPEVLEGTNSTKAITPTGLQSKVVNNVNITCSELIASATAVKCAYDAAILAQSPPYATTTTQGVVCLATAAETQAGLDSTKAITPLDLQSKVSCCVNSTSDTLIASSSAVKVAYDAAVAAVTLPATTTIEGKVFLATDAEVQAGTDSTKAVVSSALQSKISNCVDLVSGTTIASSTAVKAAYDIGADAIPKANLLGLGSLVTATGAGLPIGLSAGTTGQYLVADGTCTEGLKWVTLPPIDAATPTAAGTVFGFTSNLCSNVSLGFCSLNANVGGDNTVLGDKALLSASNALTCRNTLVGGQVLCAPGAGIALDNTIVGFKGLFTSSASDRCGNTGLGACTFSSLGTGNYNLFLGYNSGTNQASGNLNVAIGGCSLQLPNITGSCQLAIGYDTNNFWITGCSDKSITVPGGIRDCAGSKGTAGQVLTSTGTALAWSTPSPSSTALAYGSFGWSNSLIPAGNGSVSQPYYATFNVAYTCCNLGWSSAASPGCMFIYFCCPGIYSVLFNGTMAIQGGPGATGSYGLSTFLNGSSLIETCSGGAFYNVGCVSSVNVQSTYMRCFNAGDYIGFTSWTFNASACWSGPGANAPWIMAQINKIG